MEIVLMNDNAIISTRASKESSKESHVKTSMIP